MCPFGMSDGELGLESRWAEIDGTDVWLTND